MPLKITVLSKLGIHAAQLGLQLQTVLFNMRHPTFGINSLILSVSLIHILVFHLLTTLHKSDPHCHHHHIYHQ